MYSLLKGYNSNTNDNNKLKEINSFILSYPAKDDEFSVLMTANGVDTFKINGFGDIGFKNIISGVEFINGVFHFDAIRGKGTNLIIEVKA
jgi:hypothetical protein